MLLKNKLSLLGIVISVSSLIIYLLLHVLALKDMGLLLFIFGAVALVSHQTTIWWIFYRFAVTRQRMKNRLQFMHQVALGVTFGFTFLYIGVNVLWGMGLYEKTDDWQTLLIVLLMVVYILYQENNTHNLISLNLHKKVNQSKKAMNQYIGFALNWLMINILWNSIGLSKGLPVFAFIYVFLILVQNSLNYTTLGQSRYWNFTYEVVLLIHLYCVAIQNEWMALFAVTVVLSIVLFLRQWRWLNYKRRSKIIGVCMIVFANSILVFMMRDGLFFQESLSYLIPFPFILYLIILAIVYIINEPSFYKRLTN